jgi:hypothetical protein
MKKLICTLLVAFLAGLAASTWTAGASETSSTHLLRAGQGTAVHQAKAKKAPKKHKKRHNKKHNQQTKA